MDIQQSLDIYGEEELAAIESHIEEHFGHSESVFHEIVSPDVHIDIVLIEPSPERDRIVLVTMGVGACRMNVPKVLEDENVSRMELVSILPKEWNIHSNGDKDYWPLGTMKGVGRFPIECETWLGTGHSVWFGSEEFPGTDFVGYILLPPFIADEGAVCTLPGGDDVNFYQLIPLYEDEMDYKINNGVNSLMQLFFLAFGEDWDGVIDVTRKSVVKMALNEYRSALGTVRETGYPYIYEDLGRFLDSAHRYTEGVALLTEAIEKDPNNTSLYAVRGELYLDMNRQKEAQSDLLRAISDTEALEDYWNMNIIYNLLGHSYEMYFNDAESALRYYNMALESDPDDDYALSCIGDLHCYYLNQYAEAVDYYDAAIELAPEEAKRYLKRDGAYKALHTEDKSNDDYNTAMQIYLEQLEDNPDGACLNCGMGECLLGLGKYKDALVYLGKAVANGGNCQTCPPQTCHEAYFALCRYHAEIGEKLKAEEYLKKAIASSNAVRYNQFKIEVQ